MARMMFEYTLGHRLPLERCPGWTAIGLHRRSAGQGWLHDLRRAMEKRKIEEQADELLGFGFAHQQVYEQLRLEHPELKPKKIAEVLANRPSAEARRRFAKLHLALLVLIALNAVVKLAQSWDPQVLSRGFSYGWISLVPIATVLVGYGLYRWKGELFGWIGWVNLASGLSLIGQLRHLADGRMDPWALSLSAIALAIGLITIYLSRKAFPQYEKVKDPLGGPSTYLFQQEDMGTLMR